MKKSEIFKFAVFLALGAVAACASDSVSDKGSSEGSELVFSSESEPVKGKSDVYQSMARTVKYNVDGASQNLNKKIFNPDPKRNPQEVINSILSAPRNEYAPLVGASNVLEYAIVYAMSVLQENSQSVEANLYAKSSQHLALAAIRSHQDAWSAVKKNKEIGRLIKQENKILKDLNDKQERMGELDKASAEYKKNLEVALMKLEEMQSALTFQVAEYSQLVKANEKNIELEGRRFYELEDFDKSYDLNVFEEAALRNRNEFAWAKEKLGNYDVKRVKDYTVREYPDVARLEVNGMDVGNELYIKELETKAVAVANNLITMAVAYKNDKEKDKIVLLKKVFDEMGAAVLTQVKVNYTQIKLADLVYKKTAKDIAAIQKEISSLNKLSHAGNQQKLEMLNNRIRLFELQRTQSQINGERAVALRGLYFNAGLTPFNKKVLRAPIKDIAALLRVSFSKDLTMMLSAAAENVHDIEKSPSGNDWAKKEDWLEVLMASPQGKKAAYTKRSGLKKEKPIYGNADASYKKMQLGAYLEQQNAYEDEKFFKAKFPELQDYSFKLEPTEIDGVLYFRLMVESEHGHLADICNKINLSGWECMLR